MKKKNFYNKGFLIVEMLVAISIIAISILAAMAVAQKSVYVSRESFHATEAGFLLEEGAEAVRIVKTTDWLDTRDSRANIDIISRLDYARL